MAYSASGLSRMAGGVLAGRGAARDGRDGERAARGRARARGHGGGLVLRHSLIW